MLYTIDKELDSYIKLLDTAQKMSLLKVIKSYLMPEETKSITMEQYNREIEESENEIANGISYSQEEVSRISKIWTSGK